MTIVAVSMFRDEADVAAGVVEHLFEQGVDKIVIADNGSVDGTREILENYPITVVDDPEVGYYQSEKITKLFLEHSGPGDWIIPFDADELWVGDGRTLAEQLSITPPEIGVLEAPVFDYFAQRSDDLAILNPFRRIQWRNLSHQVFPVVAFRHHPQAVVKQGAHGVHHPGEIGFGIEVYHFQYRSFDHFCRKVRNGLQAYEATNLPYTQGQHWRIYGLMSDEELMTRWERLLDTPGLIHDPIYR